MRGWIRWLQSRAKSLKREAYVLYCAWRDPRMPVAAKLAAICVAAYAFSPIDLIPDFIPVLGYVDDLVLVPLGIALVLKMIPESVLKSSREKAEELRSKGKPTSKAAGWVILAIWAAAAVWAVYFVYGRVWGKGK